MAARISRRQLLARTAAAACAAVPLPAIAQAQAGRVAVVGGGFAGATCARFIKRADPRIIVTLVEASPVYTACPLSNAVIASLRELKGQQFRLEKLADDGVVLAGAPASSVDMQARLVTLTNSARVSYDRLVLAPGIDLRFDALP